MAFHGTAAAAAGNATPPAMAASMGGPLGMTPAPSPTMDRPHGTSPVAKRPLDRSSFQVAQSGVRTMTMEDLSAGFIALNAGAERDAQWVMSVAAAVHDNAGLLNALIERVNTLEAAVKLNVQKVDGHTPEIAQVQADLRKGLELLEKGDVDKDQLLRAQLDAVTERLDSGYKELKANLEQVASELAGARVHRAAAERQAPPPPPGLSEGQLQELQARMGGLAKHVEQSMSRIDVLEGSCIRLGQASEGSASEIAALRVAVSEVVAQVQANMTPGPVFDSWAGQKIGQPHQPQPQQQQQQPQQAYASFNIGSAPGSPSQPMAQSQRDPVAAAKWRMYDEKWMLSGEGKYNSAKPLSWLKDVRDYIAGRTESMDYLLTWIEGQEAEIDVEEVEASGSAPMIVDAPSLKEVARQLWAFLGPLVKHDSTVNGIFANVPRHNGLEGWRRIAAPINEDKAMVRRSFLSLVSNPKPAASLEKIESAIEDWYTTKRLYREADGAEQSDLTRIPASKCHCSRLTTPACTYLPPAKTEHCSFQDYQFLSRPYS